jgi:hypothetical protein
MLTRNDCVVDTHAAVLGGYRALICGIFTINYIFESLSTVKIHALILSPAAFSRTFDVVRRLLLVDVREVYGWTSKVSSLFMMSSSALHR